MKFKHLLAATLVMPLGLLSVSPGHAHDIKAVTAPDLPSLGPYSHAVAANGFLFVSGTIAVDPATGKFIEGDIKAQTHQVFENLKKVLKAGGASLDDVVKTTVFLKNPADFGPMNEVYASYFKNRKPARSTVPGVSWGNNPLLIEIEVVAVPK